MRGRDYTKVLLWTEYSHPPRIHVEDLTSGVVVFGDGASKVVIKVKRGYKGGGPDLIGSVSL